MKIRHSEKGFALITVVTFTWMLFASGLTYFDILMSERRLVFSSENILEAEALAEAGVEEVLWEYNYSQGDFLSTEGWSGIATKTKTVTGFTDTGGTTVGDYTVSVENWNAPSPLITVIANLANTNPTVQIAAKAKVKPKSTFDAAVKAKGAVSFSSNAYTDSYNSSLGPYGGANIHQNGDVVTNATLTNAITLASNAFIKGDAGTGFGGTVSNPSAVTGSVTSGANETIFNSTVPALLTALPSLGTLNSSTTLSGGNYKFNDVDLSSNQAVTINGNVAIYLTSTSTALQLSSNSQIVVSAGSSLTIYTDGNFNLSSNSSIGGSVSPSAIQIYGTATATSFVMNSNTNVTGVISAPQAGVQLSSNANVYGAVVADTFLASSNAHVHYDEALGTSGGPTQGVDLEWFTSPPGL